MAGVRWYGWAALGIAFVTTATQAQVTSPAARSQSSDSVIMAQRAEVTLATARKWLATDDGTGLYQERYPAHSPDGAHADEWPFSQVHIGVLDLAAVPGPTGARYREALVAHRAAQMLYWIDRSTTGHPGFASRVTPPRGKGGDLFYDDNEWVGLAAAQHWLFYRDAESLDLAKKIFTLVRSAWDTNPRHPAPGGLFWTQATWNSDRNTVSNMPAAQLGLRLFEATRNKSYLDDALRFYSWTNRTLQRRDGLYFDNIDLKGKIDERVFTYNQGVPIGVNVLLYKATGEARYLTEARRIADASFTYFVTERRIDRQPLPFNAIYFKNLLLLESVIGGTRYRDAMRDYADQMWRDHRDAKTGLFVEPHPRSHKGIQLIDQGAMLQIFAVLAWKPEDYARLY